MIILESFFTGYFLDRLFSELYVHYFSSKNQFISEVSVILCFVYLCYFSCGPPILILTFTSQYLFPSQLPLSIIRSYWIFSSLATVFFE